LRTFGAYENPQLCEVGKNSWLESLGKAQITKNSRPLWTFLDKNDEKGFAADSKLRAKSSQNAKKRDSRRLT
jgi:hypothetical protein